MKNKKGQIENVLKVAMVLIFVIIGLALVLKVMSGSFHGLSSRYAREVDNASNGGDLKCNAFPYEVMVGGRNSNLGDDGGWHRKFIDMIECDRIPGIEVYHNDRSSGIRNTYDILAPGGDAVFCDADLGEVACEARNDVNHNDLLDRISCCPTRDLYIYKNSKRYINRDGVTSSGEGILQMCRANEVVCGARGSMGNDGSGYIDGLYCCRYDLREGYREKTDSWVGSDITRSRYYNFDPTDMDHIYTGRGKVDIEDWGDIHYWGNYQEGRIIKDIIEPVHGAKIGCIGTSDGYEIVCSGTAPLDCGSSDLTWSDHSKFMVGSGNYFCVETDMGHYYLVHYISAKGGDGPSTFEYRHVNNIPSNVKVAGLDPYTLWVADGSSNNEDFFCKKGSDSNYAAYGGVYNYRSDVHDNTLDKIICADSRDVKVKYDDQHKTLKKVGGTCDYPDQVLCGAENADNSPSYWNGIWYCDADNIWVDLSSERGVSGSDGSGFTCNSDEVVCGADLESEGNPEIYCCKYQVGTTVELTYGSPNGGGSGYDFDGPGIISHGDAKEDIYITAGVDEDVILPMNNAKVYDAGTNSNVNCEDTNLNYVGSSDIKVSAGDTFCVISTEGDYYKVHYLRDNTNTADGKSKFLWTHA